MGSRATNARRAQGSGTRTVIAPAPQQRCALKHQWCAQGNPASKYWDPHPRPLPTRGRGASANARHAGRPAFRFDSRGPRQSFASLLRRQDHAGLTGDAAVVLDAAVPLEVEDRLLAEDRGVEIAVGNDEFVVLALRLGADGALGIDDHAAADHRMAVLTSRLGDRHHEGRVLIGTGLHAEAMVEQALLRSLVGLLRVDRGRVVTERDKLDALQPHDPVGLGPAAVVADAHAEDTAKCPPHRKAEIARLEITLLQMLEAALRVILGMA